MKEYIITVKDPKFWDSGLWDELTINGLGDNYIPTRNIEVSNERPFNEWCAHFLLTEEEAVLIRNDSRIKAVELQADLQDDVKKEFLATKSAIYDKSNNTAASMKNWGLLRCSAVANPFSLSTGVSGNYNYNLDGTGVDIIVIDSGVSANHPEFAVNSDGTGGSRVVDFNWQTLGVPGTPSAASIGGYLGDSDGHGSNCASIAAGNTCGWASGAAIYSIRIFGGYDIVTGNFLDAISSDIAFDLVRAFHLAKISAGNNRPTICTNSWGYRTTYSGMQYTVWRGTQYNNTTANNTYGQVYYYHPYSLTYINVSVDNAASVGVIMVGAAGNYRHKIDVVGGIDYNNYYRYSDGFYTEDVYYHRGSSPTCASSMICVGAIDNNVDNLAVEQKVYFSESGPRVDIYSPGTMIMGAYANEAYLTPAVPDPRNTIHYLNKISGTSQATPQVTGLLACVLQARPKMTIVEAKKFLEEYSLKNVLVEGASTAYTSTTYLQGGANRYLYMPFNSSTRGSIAS